MMDIEKIWTEKRWLFWLLLPIIGLVFIAQLVTGTNQVTSTKTMDDAKEKDDKIKDRDNQLQAEEVVRRIKATTAKRRLKSRKVEDIPANWHETHDEEIK